jgi:hypothetical protein
MTMTNWTPELLRAESDYRRQQLRRLASHRTERVRRTERTGRSSVTSATGVTGSRAVHWWSRLRRSGAGGAEAA